MSFLIKKKYDLKVILPIILLSLLNLKVNAVQGKNLSVDFPDIIVEDIDVVISITGYYSDEDTAVASFFVNDEKVEVEFVNGKGNVSFTPVANQYVTVKIDNREFVSKVKAIPLWFSVVPPLIAIIFALVFKEVFTALIIGLLSGTFVIAWYSGAGLIASLGIGLFRIIDTYVIETIANKDHVSIIVFTFLIGGMVHIITANGGMKGVVRRISGYASSKRSTLVSTWLLGLVVFFDDYANTLVVGNTMRSLTDRMRISREKLAYVVDSTAAPVSAIAFITTWIGAELSYIKNAVDTINLTSEQVITASPYSIFFQSLAYSFYPILALLFVIVLILSKRDYGPMVKAEMLASKRSEPVIDSESKYGNKSDEIEVAANIKPRGFNALIPIITVILGTCAGLVYTGIDNVGWDTTLSFGENLSNVIGSAESFKALLWASFGGLIVAVFLTLVQRLISLQSTIQSMIKGFSTMLTAMIILVLAWSLALLTKNLYTADFLSQVMIYMEIAPQYLPVITFILAALVSFSTGSSWGTMAILYPLLLPTSWVLFQDYAIDYENSMMLFNAVVASVLAGAVFGDHCSPISDTTILSSLATRCNHIEHIRTQLPYAITVGIVSVFIGLLPVSFGLNPIVAFIGGLIVLWLIIRFVGKKIPS